MRQNLLDSTRLNETRRASSHSVSSASRSLTGLVQALVERCLSLVDRSHDEVENSLHSIGIGETRQKWNNDVDAKLLSVAVSTKNTLIKSVTHAILDRRVFSNGDEELILDMPILSCQCERQRRRSHFDVDEMFSFVNHLQIGILNRMFNSSCATRPKRTRTNTLSIDFDRSSVFADDRTKPRNVHDVLVIVSLGKKVRIRVIETIFVCLEARPDGPWRRRGEDENEPCGYSIVE